MPIYVSPEWQRSAYSIAALMTPYAAATDIVVLRGSATKIVRLSWVEVVLSATAAGVLDIQLTKHSIANTAGTSTTPTPTPHDSGDPPATAVVLQYSAAPTISGTPPALRASKAGISAASAMVVVRWDFGTRWVKLPTLRGVAQELAINLNADVLLAGELAAYSMEWFEDNQ